MSHHVLPVRPRLIVRFSYEDYVVACSVAIALEPLRTYSMFELGCCLKRQFIASMPERLMHQLKLIKL